MNHSDIEYIINPDGTKGYAWNFQTGCLNWQKPSVCPVGLNCWAKRMAERFHRSFEPALHPEKLLDPLKLKKPATIGVCFTGDLFGDWVDPERIIQDPYTDIRVQSSLKLAVLETIKFYPQHRFLFLTKCPQNLKRWGRFPDNAWVGVSICNQKQHNAAISILAGTDAKHKWISYEPLLEEINMTGVYDFKGINWVVLGLQTPYNQKTAPKTEWVDKIIKACRKECIPIWTKDNIIETRTGPSICALHQELPFMREFRILESSTGQN